MSKIWGQLERAQLEVRASDHAATASGLIWFNSSTNRAKFYDGSGVVEIVTLAHTQSLSNKTLVSPLVSGGLLSDSFASFLSPASIAYSRWGQSGGSDSYSIGFNNTGAKLEFTYSPNSNAAPGTGTLFGSLTAGGIWTLGAVGSNLNQIVNGASLTLTQSNNNVAYLSAYNSNNTASSEASCQAQSTHVQADAYHRVQNGTETFCWGLDGSDSSKVVFSNFATPGTNNRLVIDSSGATFEVTTLQLKVMTLGKGLSIKEGVNAKMGASVLVAGSVTVATTAVTANSRIFLSNILNGGTAGFLRVSTITAGTSFVITSSNGADTSTIAWMIVEPS